MSTDGCKQVGDSPTGAIAPTPFSPRSVPLCEVAHALLSGIVAASSFHSIWLAPLAWCALIPLLRSLRAKNAAHSFILCLLFGITFHSCLNYYIAVTVFTARVWFPYSLLQAALVAGAAFFGVVLVSALWFGLFGVMCAWYAKAACVRDCPPLVIASLWTLMEYLRSLGKFGYTWGDLGYSQVPLNPVLQVAAVMGCFGISFLIVWFNAALANFTLSSSHSHWRELVMVTAGVAMTFLLVDTWQRRSVPRHSNPVSVRIVQPDFSNRAKLDWRMYQRNIAVQLHLTRLPGAAPRLVLWPETAVAEPLREGSGTLRMLAEVAQSLHAWMITGGTDVDAAGREYNAAYSISDTGDLASIYRKRHLVPFGEYVPMREHWKWMRFFSFREKELRAGPKWELLPSPLGPAGVVICFESTFPGIARTMVREGATSLVVLTNDEWISGTPAPVLHLAMAQMRAVENRRFVLRAANSGISAIIDERGRITRYLKEGRQGVLDGIAFARSDRSAYSCIGDGWLLLYIALVFGNLLRDCKALKRQ